MIGSMRFPMKCKRWRKLPAFVPLQRCLGRLCALWLSYELGPDQLGSNYIVSLGVCVCGGGILDVYMVHQIVPTGRYAGKFDLHGPAPFCSSMVF